MRRAIVIVAVVALVSGIGTAAALSAQAAPRTTAVTRVVPCIGAPEVRPGQYLVACGDGGYYLTALHWVRWSPTVGIARAVAHQNDCIPFCADGHFHTTTTVVVLSDPVTRPGLGQLFSVLTLLQSRRLPGQDRATFELPLPLRVVHPQVERRPVAG